MFNYESKIDVLERVVNQWKNRQLTVTGKITVIKSMILSKLTHVLTSLPKPSEELITRLENMMYKFIWNGKRNRIRKDVLILPIEFGGQGMTDLRSFITALKIYWVKRAPYNDPYQWEAIANHGLSVELTNFIWDKCSTFMKYVSGGGISSQFWKEVTYSWGIFTNTFKLQELTMGCIPLWKSNHTNYKTTEIRQWMRSGLWYFNNLRTPSGDIMTFEEAQRMYNLHRTFLDYIGLLDGFQTAYATLKGKLHTPIISDQIRY